MCMPDVRQWDGHSYDRVSGPMEALGREVLGRMQLRGDEVVLDAGCGSGRITQALLERLPRGRVVAVDASPSMVHAARDRLGDAAEVRLADLLELELEEPVDAVISTATFHWIADHDHLFRRLLDAGFAAASCWLAPAPKQPQQPREFLATIVLGPHVQQLPEELREPFMDEVLAELGEPVVVDYVRLNIDATP